MEFWSQAPSWSARTKTLLGSVNIDFNMLLAKMQVPVDVDSGSGRSAHGEWRALLLALRLRPRHRVGGADLCGARAGAPLESWDELLEAKHLWANVTLEAGFAPGTDVESVLLGAAAAAGSAVGAALRA